MDSDQKGGERGIIRERKGPVRQGTSIKDPCTRTTGEGKED